eukprot:g16459.t1
MALETPVYGWGDDVEMERTRSWGPVEWPLEEGGAGLFRASVAKVQRKPKNCGPGPFRYLLRWADGGTSWCRLRLPHRAVLKVPGPWHHQTDTADHAETPAKAYADLARFLDALAASMCKTREDLKIYDPYYCMGACVRHMAALGFYNVWNQPLDFYNSEESIPEYDVLVTNPPKYVAPYVTLWVLTALPRVEAPPGCVLCTSRDELPARLRGVAKAAPEALERKAFNEFCRENGLGKLCATWARQGSCDCQGPFTHPRAEDAPKVRRLLKGFFLRHGATVRPSSCSPSASEKRKEKQSVPVG